MPLVNPGISILVVPIRNISAKTKIDGISIALGIPSSSAAKIVGIRLLSKAPALPGNEVEDCGAPFARITNITFHPGWEYTLLLGITEKQKPHVNLLKASEAVRLQESSVSTWIVRNEDKIILAALVAAMALSALYLLLISRQAEVDNRGHK